MSKSEVMSLIVMFAVIIVCALGVKHLIDAGSNALIQDAGGLDYEN